ncbi:MAG: hydrolase [Nitrososphaeria archaeon]|nr:hydrolase [Nitrososphaeria archaeon]NDB63754.1 hydrolase [Nitrosopumilaceae archaeon]NDB87426.1 hydrolase [Nitrososphaerota archaeon]NDB46829.1 hydrolase [Nitrososphaeria archaeon]NDB90039.1 hydrolase [Nitrososphaerota archaeon]
MMSSEKDELIRAQNELIGVLFEIIKRFQANQILDDEYFQTVSSEWQNEQSRKRLDDILAEREDNSKTIAKLLEKIQS